VKNADFLKMNDQGNLKKPRKKLATATRKKAKLYRMSASPRGPFLLSFFAPVTQASKDANMSIF